MMTPRRAPSCWGCTPWTSRCTASRHAASDLVPGIQGVGFVAFLRPERAESSTPSVMGAQDRIDLKIGSQLLHVYALEIQMHRNMSLTAMLWRDRHTPDCCCAEERQGA